MIKKWVCQFSVLSLFFILLCPFRFSFAQPVISSLEIFLKDFYGIELKGDFTHLSGKNLRYSVNVIQGKGGIFHLSFFFDGNFSFTAVGQMERSRGIELYNFQVTQEDVFLDFLSRFMGHFSQTDIHTWHKDILQFLHREKKIRYIVCDPTHDTKTIAVGTYEGVKEPGFEFSIPKKTERTGFNLQEVRYKNDLNHEISMGDRSHGSWVMYDFNREGVSVDLSVRADLEKIPPFYYRFTAWLAKYAGTEFFDITPSQFFEPQGFLERVRAQESLPDLDSSSSKKIEDIKKFLEASLGVFVKEVGGELEGYHESYRISVFQASEHAVIRAFQGEEELFSFKIDLSEPTQKILYDIKVSESNSGNPQNAATFFTFFLKQYIRFFAHTSLVGEEAILLEHLMREKGFEYIRLFEDPLEKYKYHLAIRENPDTNKVTEIIISRNEKAIGLICVTLSEKYKKGISPQSNLSHGTSMKLSFVGHSLVVYTPHEAGDFRPVQFEILSWFVHACAFESILFEVPKGQHGFFFLPVFGAYISTPQIFKIEPQEQGMCIDIDWANLRNLYPQAKPHHPDFSLARVSDYAYRRMVIESAIGRDHLDEASQKKGFFERFRKGFRR